MFATEAPEDFSLLSWAAQLFLSTLGPFILLASTEVALNHNLNQVVEGIACLGIAMLMARLLHRVLPRSATAGRWVWVLPTVLFLAMFTWTALLSDLRSALTDCFWPGPDGERGWIQALVTLPTLSSIVYSSVMWFRTRKAYSVRTW